MSPSVTNLNLALSQADRAAQAPDPSKVLVDDRSLAQLLSLSIEYGKLITFYDLTNAPDGDWSALFASDPAIALAIQASLDPLAIEAQMQAIGRRLRQDKRPLVLPEPWRDLVALICKLLTILRRRPLREGPLASLLSQIQQPVALVDAATTLSKYLESTGLDLRLGSHPILLREAELSRLENLLRDFLGVLLSTIEVERHKAEEQLQSELTKAGHAPHVALYIAFARLFQSFQARVNTFPTHLLDFYHQQVLRQDAIADRSLVPDRLVLSFRAKPGGGIPLVPCATPFLAGVDEEGNSINYATDQDLEVQTCQLTSLVTFRVLARRVVADNNPGLASIFGVSKTEINLPLPYPAEGPLMPLFGLQYDDLVIPTGYGQTEWGVLGFAIASPLLALDGGDRCVQLTLKIASQSLRWLMASPLMLDRVKLPDYICQALEESLAWHYTTADRLVHLKPNARILSPGDEGHELLTIILEFKLHPSDPPWQVLPQRWSQPLLLAELLQMGVRRPAGDGVESEQTFYPLELLSLLHIAAISLDVAVEQHRPTQFHSSGGTLDPSQPLPIFGPSPVCGSLFSLSLADLVDKPLDAITLRLIWHGLPISRDGFRGHYSGYLLDVDGERYPPGDLFDNDSFRVDVQLQLAASFAPAATTLLQQPLFAVVPPEPPAASAPVPPSPLASATELTLTKLGGLVGVNGLRLVLRSPPYAFGDALYGINCLDASRRLASEIQSAQTSPKTPVGQPLSEASPGWPNPPWSPRVASVEVDYRCLQARLPEDHEPRMQWLHLRPLSEPEPVTTWSAVPLLPALLPHEAMEFLGPPSSADNLQVATVELVLSQRVRQISFLFGLTTNSTQTILPFTSALRVEAQVAGDVGPSAQWLTLGRDQVVDGTNGLRCTGILHLTLPDGKTSQQFRLQVIDVSTPEASLSSPHPFAQQLISSGPVLQCLEPNAVWATWEGPGGRNQLNRSLEAGKVTAALIKLPGIEQVRQPLPSIGGVAPATAELEKVCLCERLRHKNRALQPEDYALLLLRSFPSLWQVAVLPAQKASGESLPGTVTIIPIPGPDSPTIVDTTIPTCDPVLSERLLTALRSQVSPFVRLQIAPPPYRRICVKATVVVEDQMRMAMALQQLQKDLVRFLSPWPAPDLGARPKNYYEETAISQFIRDRHYIRSIDRLELEESPVEGDDKYTSAIDLSAAKRIERTGEVSSLCQSVRYYTSALHHKLDVKAANASKRFGREESNERR